MAHSRHQVQRSISTHRDGFVFWSQHGRKFAKRSERRAVRRKLHKAVKEELRVMYAEQYQDFLNDLNAAWDVYEEQLTEDWERYADEAELYEEYYDPYEFSDYDESGWGTLDDAVDIPFSPRRIHFCENCGYRNVVRL